MSHTSRNVNRETGLEMSLNAAKSLLSDYAMRARQAEAATQLLITQKMDADGIARFATLVGSHMDLRSKERAVHQQALLQNVLAALSLVGGADEATLRSTVNNTVKQITIALGHMNIPAKPANQQHSFNLPTQE